MAKKAKKAKSKAKKASKAKKERKGRCIHDVSRFQNDVQGWQGKNP